MRHINERLVRDLLYGELAFFLNQVKNARNRLSLEIRNGYINIYYMGGSLLKIMHNTGVGSLYSRESSVILENDGDFCVLMQ